MSGVQYLQAKNLLPTATAADGLASADLSAAFGADLSPEAKRDAEASGGAATFLGTSLNHQQISAALYGGLPSDACFPHVGLPAHSSLPNVGLPTDGSLPNVGLPTS